MVLHLDCERSMDVAYLHTVEGDEPAHADADADAASDAPSTTQQQPGRPTPRLAFLTTIWRRARSSAHTLRAEGLPASPLPSAPHVGGDQPRRGRARGNTAASGDSVGSIRVPAVITGTVTRRQSFALQARRARAGTGSSGHYGGLGVGLGLGVGVGEASDGHHNLREQAQDAAAGKQAVSGDGGVSRVPPGDLPQHSHDHGQRQRGGQGYCCTCRRGPPMDSIRAVRYTYRDIETTIRPDFK